MNSFPTLTWMIPAVVLIGVVVGGVEEVVAQTTPPFDAPQVLKVPQGAPDSPSATAQPLSELISKVSGEEIEAIVGKWRVVKVQRDGPHQHGQVGQEVGDIITVKSALNGLVLG